MLFIPKNKDLKTAIKDGTCNWGTSIKDLQIEQTLCPSNKLSARDYEVLVVGARVFALYEQLPDNRFGDNKGSINAQCFVCRASFQECQGRHHAGSLAAMDKSR